MAEPFQRDSVFEGVPLSGGIAVARVCRFNDQGHSAPSVYTVAEDDVAREVGRVRDAAERLSHRLDVIGQEALERLGPAEAEIFTAQKMVLEDEVLHTNIADFIAGHKKNAEAAVSAVFDSFEARLREMDDEYLRERASDFGEIKRRLLDVLSDTNPEFQCTENTQCRRGKDRIVVSEELTPSLTMEIDTSRTLGFVTARGGEASHAAILARALGIPAVSGLKDIHRAVSCGTEIMINGDTGQVVVWPSDETVTRVRATLRDKVRVPQAVDPVPGFEVMANVSVLAEAEEAARMQAEGIGLYRTEFEFIGSDRPLTEDQQYERYATVIEAMPGKPVTFRLFDAGGDKPLPFLDIPLEENPALGWRGARLLLDHDSLLPVQARALARASQHAPIRVLYPMIIDVAQFLALKRMFDAAVTDLPTGEMQHGVMFEVPSACLQAAQLLEAADFGSIGSNDLIQYLFAVDRNNDLVAHDHRADRPVLWDLMARIAQAARRAGKPLAVCGELAGDPRYIPKLRETGITSVSVSPRLISGARLSAMAGDTGGRA